MCHVGGCAIGPIYLQILLRSPRERAARTMRAWPAAEGLGGRPRDLGEIGDGGQKGDVNIEINIWQSFVVFLCVFSVGSHLLKLNHISYNLRRY